MKIYFNVHQLRWHSMEASGVPRQVKVERRTQKQTSGPTYELGFGMLGTLSGWGACYPERKARREAGILI
jgi:hypothetical protein